MNVILKSGFSKQFPVLDLVVFLNSFINLKALLI